MELSSLLNRFNEPETLKMARLGRELRAKGIDVVDLSLGEPDFNTPDHIKLAAIAAIEENYSHYPPLAGFLELKEAICYKFERDNQLKYKPENIIVSTGAKQSLANVILSIVDSGDEVVIPTPYWVTYSALVQLALGKVVLIQSTLENGYKITIEQLRASLNKKTKVFLFSSPCNPSGAVYTKEELSAMAEVFMEYPDVVIISDEIYEYINYRGKHESIAQFEGLKDRIVIVNGLSKGFAMTGWRLGYIAAPVAIIKGCEKIQGQMTSGANAIAQRAAITALNGPLDSAHAMLKEFTLRKQKMLELMGQIEGLRFTNPDGAFYAFPQVDFYFGKSDGEQTISNADDMTMYLLNNAHVSTVTGSAFGDDQCIRLSYANSMENIEEGMKRIAEALGKLR